MTDRGTSALVLGGGGITGIAWELGILARTGRGRHRPHRGRHRRGHVGRVGGRRAAGQRTLARRPVRLAARAAGRRAGRPAVPHRRAQAGAALRPARQRTRQARPRRSGRPGGARAGQRRPRGRDPLPAAGARLARRGTSGSPPWTPRAASSPSSPATPGWTWCRRWRPAAPSPRCGRRSRSRVAPTWTAGCAPPPTSTWPGARPGRGARPAAAVGQQEGVDPGADGAGGAAGVVGGHARRRGARRLRPQPARPGEAPGRRRGGTAPVRATWSDQVRGVWAGVSGSIRCAGTRWRRSSTRPSSSNGWRRGRGAGEPVVAGVADEQRGEGGQDDEGEEVVMAVILRPSRSCHQWQE